MKIDGYEITVFSEYDGKPVKSKLPQELKEKLRTEKQWLEVRRQPIAGILGYEMHTHLTGMKLFTYYLESQTEPLPDNIECCATCTIRNKQYCVIAGEHISMAGRCSEWSNTVKVPLWVR